MARLKVTYRKNPAYAEHNADLQPKLYARLDLSGFNITGAEPEIPIYYRKPAKPMGPIRVIYRTLICGLPVETGNLTRLEERIEEFLATLVRFERLPSYFFQVQRKAYPIYQLEDQFLTRYPGGPVFSAEAIPVLRRWLADHFKRVGAIQSRKELTLLYLSPHSLSLYAPVCFFRAPGTDVDDMPLFLAETRSEAGLFTPVNSRTLNAPFENWQGLIRLHSLVGHYLQNEGLVPDPSLLTIRKLLPNAWRTLEQSLTGIQRSLTYVRSNGAGFQRMIHPIYSADEVFIAARNTSAKRVTLYAAHSLTDLQQRLASDLIGYGVINSRGDVQFTRADRNESKQVSVLDSIISRPGALSSNQR